MHFNKLHTSILLLFLIKKFNLINEMQLMHFHNFHGLLFLHNYIRTINTAAE